MSTATRDQRQAMYEIAEAIAPGWERRRAQVEEVAAPMREWMLRELRPAPGDTLLELAAGVGDTGFEAAALAGEGSRLITTDFSPAMLAAARRRGAELGVENVDYRVMDAERIELADESVDGVLCRFGYMLMPDPSAALAETRRVLREGGRLTLAVWGALERNPMFAIAAVSLLQRGHIEPPPPEAPGPFSMASLGSHRGAAAGRRVPGGAYRGGAGAAGGPGRGPLPAADRRHVGPDRAHAGRAHRACALRRQGGRRGLAAAVRHRRSLRASLRRPLRGGPVRTHLLAVALALALPASASAGQPFTLDTGGKSPHVAVSEDGTGHFVWESRSGPSAVGYCQVPRGGRSCTKTRRWAGLEGVNVEGPRVLLHPDGRIVIVAGRGCDRVALESEDGGATFSEPTEISGGCPGAELGFRAELGPGENTVSYLLGGKFKAAPLDGPPTVHGYAQLGPLFESGLAFLNTLTPIVALWDLDRITVRQYSGRGDLNDASNWFPAVDVGAGEEPDLAGGVRGVYISYETAGGQVVHHYDEATRSFESPQQISDGETSSGDFHQSASGSLHQTWTRPGDAPLSQRRSLDGLNWLPTETLTDDDSGFFHQHLATAGDGGGFAVWDHTTAGDARAVEVVTNADVSNGSGLCKVQVGLAVAIAREGCFESRGSLHTATGDVRINGIDLSGSGRVAIDVKERTLKTSAAVTAAVGNVKLDRQQLDWRIPKGAGAIKDSAGNEVTFDAAKANSEVLGLAVSGWTTPRIVAGETVELPVNLELPAP